MDSGLGRQHQRVRTAKWALFYSSSLALAVAIGLAAAGAAHRRTRAVLGGAALLSAAGGALGLRTLADSAYGRLFDGLGLRFAALVIFAALSGHPNIRTIA